MAIKIKNNVNQKAIQKRANTEKLKQLGTMTDQIEKDLVILQEGSPDQWGPVLEGILLRQIVILKYLAED